MLFCNSDVLGLMQRVGSVALPWEVALLQAYVTVVVVVVVVVVDL